MPGIFASKQFFLWDPLEEDYKHSKMKFFFRERLFMRLNFTKKLDGNFNKLNKLLPYELCNSVSGKKKNKKLF